MEGDKDEAVVLNLSFKIKMVLQEFRLPEVPGGNKALATGFEVGFDLF